MSIPKPYQLLLITCALIMAVWTSTVQAQQRTETRCGWFQNPTPSNAWLNDRDGRWIISTQGGFQAAGDWPNIPKAQWINTNGSYGYGCACMKVVANKPKRQIIQILSANPRPLSACRQDPALREPR